MPVINTALNVTVGDWKARMHVTNTVTKIMVSGAKTEDGECTTEFRTRLNRGQAIEASLQKIWKSQHTDFNEDTTDEGASVACSNIRL